MTTALSDQGLQLASGNIVDVRSAMPTTGSYTAGDIVLEKSTSGEISGWKRLTTGSAHVLGTDWLYFAPLGTGQTLQSVTRTSGVTYTNTTGRQIWVLVDIVSASATNATTSIAINGGSAFTIAHCSTTSGQAGGTGVMVIPPGATYVLTDNANVAIRTTAEIR